MNKEKAMQKKKQRKMSRTKRALAHLEKSSLTQGTPGLSKQSKSIIMENPKQSKPREGWDVTINRTEQKRARLKLYARMQIRKRSTHADPLFRWESLMKSREKKVGTGNIFFKKLRSGSTKADYLVWREIRMMTKAMTTKNKSRREIRQGSTDVYLLKGYIEIETD